MDTWGEGDAKVSVGDVVKVRHQFDHRGGGWREGTVVNVGRKLLHVQEGRPGDKPVTYVLEDQQLNGNWSGQYQTLAQRAAEDQRDKAVELLKTFGVTSTGTTRSWSSWSTEELLDLCVAVVEIKVPASKSVDISQCSAKVDP